MQCFPHSIAKCCVASWSFIHQALQPRKRAAMRGPQHTPQIQVSRNRYKWWNDAAKKTDTVSLNQTSLPCSRTAISHLRNRKLLWAFPSCPFKPAKGRQGQSHCRDRESSTQGTKMDRTMAGGNGLLSWGLPEVQCLSYGFLPVGDEKKVQ